VITPELQRPDVLLPPPDGPRRRRRTVAALTLVPAAIIWASLATGLPLHGVVGLAAVVMLLAASATGATRRPRWHGALSGCAPGMVLACLATGSLAALSGRPMSLTHAILGGASLLLIAPLWLRPVRGRPHALLGLLSAVAALSSVAAGAWGAP
jgi:hypothetical protein